jgi:glutathione S-transferase
VVLALYHAEPVANSMKALVCLHEKGLAFESRYVDLLKFEQHEPAFVAINPNGQVPVLVHDGAVVTESTVINEYLDEAFPERPLKPADAFGRARMRIWSKYVDEQFCPALSMWGWHRMVRQVALSVERETFLKLLERIPLKEQRDKWATIAGDSFSADQLAESRRRLADAVARMEAILAGSQWLAGAGYSLADVNTFSMASGAVRMFPELGEGKPRFENWLARMTARPAVRAALATPSRAPLALASDLDPRPDVAAAASGRRRA